MAKKVKARSKIGIAPKIIGAGIAAVVAGIAGAHFLQTAKNRKKLKGSRRIIKRLTKRPSGMSL